MGRTRSGLDPVRGLRTPRRTTIWRAAAVAVLLLAAAAVWAAGPTAAPSGTVRPGADQAAHQTPHPGAFPAPGPPAPGTSSAYAPSATPPPAPAGSRLPVPDGLVGVPVPLAAPVATAMLRPGDRVDLLSTGAAGDDAPRLMAADATVLAVDHPGGLLLGLTTAEAHEVIALGGAAAFSVIIRP